MDRTTNRHPVDRLADVREQIKVLDEEADSLKAAILASGQLKGAEYLAQVSEAKRATLDRDKLEAAFGKVAVAACTKESVSTVLRLRRLA